jgi:hypothetical protein
VALSWDAMVGRLLIALLAGVLCGLAVAPLVAAKGDVRARLGTPVPRTAKPGTTLELAWTLTSVDGAQRRPFGAGGVFVELRDAAGGATTIGRASDSSGHYRARVTVPAGGIGGVAVGLDAWQYAGSHPASATAARGRLAQLFFPIENDPFAGAQADGGRGAVAPWALLLAGLAVLGLLLLAGRAITVRRAVA